MHHFLFNSVFLYPQTSAIYLVQTLLRFIFFIPKVIFFLYDLILYKTPGLISLFLENLLFLPRCS